MNFLKLYNRTVLAFPKTVIVTLTLVCQIHGNHPRGSNGAPGAPAELLKQFTPFIRHGLETVATPAAVPATNNKS